MTHSCVGNLTIIGSDNGLSPIRRQAIIWTNAGLLSIGPLRTTFSEILIEIHTFSFKKMYLKISSGKWRPFCFGLNVLTGSITKSETTLTEKLTFWVKFGTPHPWLPVSRRLTENCLTPDIYPSDIYYINYTCPRAIPGGALTTIIRPPPVGRLGSQYGEALFQMAGPACCGGKYLGGKWQGNFSDKTSLKYIYISCDRHD